MDGSYGSNVVPHSGGPGEATRQGCPGEATAAVVAPAAVVRGASNSSVSALHAGRLIAQRLRASGIDTVFTLSGGHLFPIHDGCRDEGIRLIDTRHEQTAAFVAEG
jgi:hypothetical protein